MSELLTVPEAAALLRVSEWTVDPALAADVMKFADGVRRILPPAVLYRFYDRDGVLLYVGITSQGVPRWAAHARVARWWRQVRTVTVEHYRSAIEAGAAERYAIRTEGPRHNIAHKPR